MIKNIELGVCAAKGFKAAGVSAEIKKGSKKRDLAVIYCESICSAAALYTTNKVKGAPITVTMAHLADGKAQAIIVNSGNANTCNANGLEIAEGACELLSSKLDIDGNDIIVASTGVIGQPMSLKPFEQFVPQAVTELSKNGSGNACEAIMTTDTRKKEVAVCFEIDGKECHIGGISKGSGMINPNMATMLAFLTTDVAISSKMLKEVLTEVNSDTYNMVSVDGDTSTNDMVCIMASGLAGNIEISDKNAEYGAFSEALYAVMSSLARETARDGEGATKLLTAEVVNAPSKSVAKTVAKSVISSSLLKAAMFAADANWGRVLCAIGYAKAEFDIQRVSVEFISRNGRIVVCENGSGIPFSEEIAHNVLSDSEITILIDMHGGSENGVAWGCDLTYDYVKINAEYRS